MRAYKFLGFIDVTVVLVIIAILLAILLSSGGVPKLSPDASTERYTPDFSPDGPGTGGGSGPGSGGGPGSGSGSGSGSGGSGAGETTKESLQLKTFKFKRIVVEDSCSSSIYNEEPNIIYGSDPAFTGAAKAGGQIKIWVWEDDGNGGSVSPGTVVDPSNGNITSPGDRTAADPNGYLWEPAIYLTQLTTPDQPGPYAGDKENGGQAYFPVAIKGVANFGADLAQRQGDLNSAPIDPPVNIQVSRTDPGWTFSEFIWDVNSMNLTAGYYRAQIILHDGDQDLAINCTTIQI